MSGNILVLIGTYNGEAFLSEQLESIFNNSVKNIDVVLSDDRSADQTLPLAKNFADNWTKGSFAVVEGPGRNFAENYMHLVREYAQGHEYVAFSDQDDIWDPDKLEVAIDWLQQFPDRPALYCSRTRYIDEHGRFMRLSPLFSKPPDLRNALVQSIAGGNTMVLNRQAILLLSKTRREVPIVSHDWWAYLMVSACGGVVHYDRLPHIGYRQHELNLVGANDTNLARLKRIIALFRGRLRGWTDLNLDGLRAIEPLLTDESRDLIHTVEKMRAAKLPTRMMLLVRSGLYRQTFLGTLGLIVAVAFRLF